VNENILLKQAIQYQLEHRIGDHKTKILRMPLLPGHFGLT